ncbi:MAG: HAMP domain-containing sensor histidine kinase [Bacteroidota bacterium]
MKLLTKTILNYLSVTLFVFMFAAIAFYYLLRTEVNQNINLELEKRKTSILDQLLSAHSSVVTPPNQNERVVITPLKSVKAPQMSFCDTMFYDYADKKYVPFRQLGFVATFNQTTFYIQIYKSLEETDNLIVRIFLIMAILVFVIIATLLITIRYTSKRAWNSFYDTVGKLNSYDINSQSEFSLETPEVKEFADLNKVLTAMIARIRKDYLNMKEYTENASHELQTPLAIINMKMELLLQSKTLDEKQLKAVLDAYEASNRLSKLNQTLLLLAKIENRQFPESKPVVPQNVIENQLEMVEDLIESKDIHVVKHFDPKVVLLMNPYLADILFANLIKNAIRHNLPGGELIIRIESNSLTISNSGKELKIDKEMLFGRFHKQSASPESLGLGLAIVQKICEVYGFTVDYRYEDSLHHFCVDYSKAVQGIGK